MNLEETRRANGKVYREKKEEDGDDIIIISKKVKNKTSERRISLPQEYVPNDFLIPSNHL